MRAPLRNVPLLLLRSTTRLPDGPHSNAKCSPDMNVSCGKANCARPAARPTVIDSPVLKPMTFPVIGPFRISRINPICSSSRIAQHYYHSTPSGHSDLQHPCPSAVRVVQSNHLDRIRIHATKNPTLIAAQAAATDAKRTVPKRSISITAKSGCSGLKCTVTCDPTGYLARTSRNLALGGVSTERANSE